jgi:spermidine synthase
LRSLVLAFPYVRAFDEPRVGVYCLCSTNPISFPSDSGELMARMPQSAIKDLVEWSPGDEKQESRQRLDSVLSREIAVNEVLDPDRSIKVTDDRPYNEYFFLRNTLARRNGTYRNFDGPFNYLRSAKVTQFGIGSKDTSGAKE